MRDVSRGYYGSARNDYVVTVKNRPCRTGPAVQKAVNHGTRLLLRC
jgi:hypothetical protein